MVFSAGGFGWNAALVHYNVPPGQWPADGAGLPGAAVPRIWLLVGLVNGFTTAFVVPVIILDGGGVLDGWSWLWPAITAQPWQYLAYALTAFVLGIAGGVLVAFLVGIAAVLLLIPFGVLGLLGYALYVAVLAVIVLLFALSPLAVLALAQVPVVTYLRYYALLVLGDVDEDLDHVSERRGSIRA